MQYGKCQSQAPKRHPHQVAQAALMRSRLKWSMEVSTSEHFCAPINQLKGKVTMLFITHALSKNLQVDEIVQIGADRANSSASGTRSLEAIGEPA